MTLAFHALWLLCALASPALGAAALGNPLRGRLSLTVGFAVIASTFGPFRPPDPVWVGVLASVAAAALLLRPRWVVVAGATAGALAGVWMALLRIEGLPWPVAAVVAILPPLAAQYLATSRPRFAPPIVRDDALLFALTLGIVVAIVPGILDGWRSAVALNVRDHDSSALIVPAWTFTLAAGSLACGGLFTLWRRG